MKQLKIFGLLVLLMVAGLTLRAQNDVVKLKDGSFVRGTILEYIAGDHVRIKTEEGKVYEFPAADIQSTQSGAIGGDRGSKTFTLKTKGYYNITGLGLNFGNNYGSLTAAPGLYMVNGWQWNKHLMTGVGIGMEYLNYAPRFPLTLDARWKILPGNVTPYVGVSGGYTFSGASPNYYYDYYGQSNKNRGGFTSGAQLGLMAHVAQHLGLNVSLGYRYQTFTSNYDQGFWNGTEFVSMPVTEHSYLHRVTLGFGLIFN